MSEPTSDGTPKSDPGQQADADQTSDAGAGLTSGSVFNDPTAPVWADPTAAFPATPADEPSSAWVQDTPDVPPLPPTPPGAASPYGQQPDPQQSTPPPAPPVSNPYAQQPPVQPQAQPYGQPAGSYGQPFPAYGQQTYATGAPAPSNTSAIVLTILSGLSVMTCNLLAIGSLVFGIMALTKNAADPVESRRLSKIGWIVFASIWAVAILGIIAYIIFVVAVFSNGGSSTFNSNY